MFRFEKPPKIENNLKAGKKLMPTICLKSGDNLSARLEFSLEYQGFPCILWA